MLGFCYLKVPPTVYVLQSKRGRVVRQGAGLSFFYFSPTSVIALVPVSSVDVYFAFTETSQDFQEVTIQGMLTYRVQNPAKLASMLDYTVNGWEKYRSDDPTKLSERLIQGVQTGARTYIQSRALRNVLVNSDDLVGAIGESLKNAAAISQLGVEVLDVAVSSLKPEPEMSKALQAQAREQLLREADQAIYERRNAAVELERTIRENELNTEVAVAQKTREVRETQMQGEIAVEKQRTALVQTKVENERKEAEAKGAALDAILQPVREVDWRTLLAMQGEVGASTLISSAFEELSKNADKIGQLNISPDLLGTLLQDHSNGHSKKR